MATWDPWLGLRLLDILHSLFFRASAATLGASMIDAYTYHTTTSTRSRTLQDRIGAHQNGRGDTDSEKTEMTLTDERDLARLTLYA